MKIAFSILTYNPSYITEEKINVGILFQNLDTESIHFEITKNWNRIKSFDDELDIQIFKLLIKGIEKHIFKNLSSYKIERYVKRYNNELRFGKVFYRDVDNIDDFIIETKKMFLRYDFDKANRPTPKGQLSYIKKMLKDERVEYTTKSIEGRFCENINYDYIVENHGFKLFEFENKNPQKLISSAKHWAFTANEMKDKYETVFVYDIELKDCVCESILKILSSSGSKVIKTDKAIELIMSFKEKNNSQLMFDAM